MNINIYYNKANKIIGSGNQMKNIKEFEQTFSKRMKEVRNTMKITQTALADVLKVSQSQISSWESPDLDGKYPRIDEIFRIAEKLEVSPTWLFGLSNTKNVNLSDDIDMLYRIADIIERKEKSWRIELDVMVEYSGDEARLQNKMACGFVIYTDKKHFNRFAVEYAKACDVAAMASNVPNYELPENIAVGMKKAVLDKYIKLFEGNWVEKVEEEDDDE